MEKNESNMESIEVNLTSTGKVSFSVKAYGSNADEIDIKIKSLIEKALLRKAQLEG